MLILIYGDDTFQSREKLNFLISGFKDKYDRPGLNLTRLDGTKINFGELSKNISPIPFLSKKRMVVVDNFFKKNKDFENPKEIIDYVLKFNDSITVFFEELSENEAKKNNFIKKILKLKNDDVKIYRHQKLDLAGAKEWIRKKINGCGFSIDRWAVDILAQNIGDDLWKLNNEIQKLLAYSADKKNIDKSDVLLLSPDKIENNIFAMTDAIGNRDQKTVIKILRDMFYTEGPGYILTMFARQFRILIGTKSLLLQNPAATRDFIADHLNLHPYVASKSLTQAKKFGLEELKKKYRQILETDKKIKTGAINPELALELLVI